MGCQGVLIYAGGINSNDKDLEDIEVKNAVESPELDVASENEVTPYFRGVIPGSWGGDVWCTNSETPRKLNKWMIENEERYIGATQMFVVDGDEIEAPVSTFDWRWYFEPNWYTENGGVCISEGGQLPLDN